MRKFILSCLLTLPLLGVLAAQNQVNVNLRLYGEVIYSFRMNAGDTLSIYTINEEIFMHYYDTTDTSFNRETFAFIEEGMKYYGFEFAGWSLVPNELAVVDDYGFAVFEDVDLYAIFLVPESSGYDISWNAYPVNTFAEMQDILRKDAYTRFTIGARNASNSLRFPAYPNSIIYQDPSGQQPGQSYFVIDTIWTDDGVLFDTVWYEGENPDYNPMELHYITDEMPAFYIGDNAAPVFNEDGSVFGLSDNGVRYMIATFHLIEYSYFTSDDDTAATVAYQILDPDTWGAYLPTYMDENTVGRNYFGFFLNADMEEEDAFWYPAADDNGHFTFMHGLSQTMINYSEDQPPYFYCFDPFGNDTASGMPQRSDLTLYVLREEYHTRDGVFVSDFHTVTFYYPVDQAEYIVGLDLYEPYFDELLNNNPSLAAASFLGFNIREFNDSIEEAQADSGMLDHVYFDIFDGFCLPFYVEVEDSALYRPVWYSSDSAYNGLRDNPVFICPSQDMTLRMGIESSIPVIVIAGDTVKIDDNTPLVIDITEDGSITLDLSTNTITLDSAAVTGTGISSDLVDFILSVDNNSTIAVEEDFGIRFDGENLTLQTDDSVMLTVQAPQPLVGNGLNDLFIDGNFIFSSVEFTVRVGQNAAHRRMAKMPAGVTPSTLPAVSGFASVALAAGIEVREVYYTDAQGNSVKGDPSRAVYHAAEAAYGEVDVDTQSFVPATTLVFADSNFYTDYIDGKIDIVSGLQTVGNNSTEGCYFDILGRRINGPQQGMFIFNGKVYLK